MLYERWQRIARDHQPEIALTDLQTDRRWAFAELAAAADGRTSGSGEVVFPQGNGAGFIFDVLRAWRSEAVVCPLEGEQALSPLASPPGGVAHLRTTSATTGG